MAAGSGAAWPSGRKSNVPGPELAGGTENMRPIPFGKVILASWELSCNSVQCTSDGDDKQMYKL